MFSWILKTEYIPENFRRGTQVPLYKGKNTSALDPNNYRGITLLTTFNKIFEILIWSRIEVWWTDSNAVSETQGACKKGVSSLHTAMMLQETIASNLEKGNLTFVAYLDVSKAFDRVWVEGLFYQLRKIGIVGKTWRLLYNCYKGFLCRVRLHDRYSSWYEMTCGIHQGRYLSLVKYTAFINSLLNVLDVSNLCCNIGDLRATPLGYADDMAAASTSKNKIDQVLAIVHVHSGKWRYDLNANKSAVMVYGETERINKRNIQHRFYRLGSEKVPEKTMYDHVGIKSCNCNKYIARTNDKISKGRRALSAASALGIKRGGLSIRACNIIYWSLIIPILTYGSEIWVLKQDDIDALDKFQRYSGKRIQRFPRYTPNETSFRGLGWMRLETYIYAKKLVFIRTILIRDESCIYRKLLKKRAIKFNADIITCSENRYDSPIFDILRIAIIFDMYQLVMNFLLRGHLYTRSQWKNMIWTRAWQIEDADWEYSSMFYRSLDTLNLTIGSAKYLSWWHVSDIFPDTIRACETMAKIVCKCSSLKSDDYRFKGMSFFLKSCTLCQHASYESAEHMIMSCPHNDEMRASLFHELSTSDVCREVWEQVPAVDTLKVILGGKPNDDFEFNDLIPIWRTAAAWIHKMYERTIKDRTGIG